jgi:hypothetical protein
VSGSSETDGSTDLYWYEIRLDSQVDPSWAEWLGGLELRWDEDGTTILSGPIPDQAALHGLVARVRDLGVPLLAVARLAPGAQQGHRQATDRDGSDRSSEVAKRDE